MAEKRSTPTAVAMHIIIAVDGSASSEHIVRWCAKNLLSSAHSVTLLSVLHTPADLGFSVAAVTDDLYTPVYSNSMLLAAQSESESCVQAMKSILRDTCNIDEPATHIARGPTRDVIVDFVESCQPKADLLVMGSHGHGALKRALLGSTTDYCLHHCKTPILVVKSQTTHSKQD